MLWPSRACFSNSMAKKNIFVSYHFSWKSFSRGRDRASRLGAVDIILQCEEECSKGGVLWDTDPLTRRPLPKKVSPIGPRSQKPPRLKLVLVTDTEKIHRRVRKAMKRTAKRLEQHESDEFKRPAD